MKKRYLLLGVFIFFLASCVGGTDNSDHVHNYIEDVVEATCTEEGYTIYRCDGCSDSYEDNYVSPLGHTEEELKMIESTCTSPGLTKGSYCALCGEVVMAQEAIPALGHKEVIMERVEPTCTTTGLTEGVYCGLCNTFIVSQETIPTLAHNYASNWSHDELGHYHECEDCHSKDEVIAHTPNIASPTEEENQECIECGYIICAKLEHTHTMHYFEPNNPTCVDPGNIGYYFCESCQRYYLDQLGYNEITDYEELYILELGHDEVKDNKVEATCTEAGLTEGSHCSLCKEVIIKQNEIPALGHSWNNGVITKEAICDELGVRTYTCNICSDTKTEDINALGHTENVLKAIEATCSTTGLTEGTYCSVCNKILKAQEIIPLLSHQTVIDQAVKATCTETGLTEGSHCSVCSTIIVKQQVINALGHKVVIDEGVEATCKSSGLTEGSHCSVCNDILVIQKEIPALEHHVVIEKELRPTCEEAGWKEHSYCDVCYYYIIEFEEIPALGHNYVNNICTRCNVHYYTKGLKFTLNDDQESYSVAIGNAKTATEIIIPNIYNGKPVTTIAELAFSSAQALKIVVPESVTSIANRAFQSNRSLESITLPFVGNTLNGTTNTHFGYIFGASGYSGNSQYVPASLKEVIITGGTIDSSAFYDCNSIESIVILSNITTINKSTFYKCNGLINVTLPNTLETIDKYAFQRCTSLKNITLPNNLKTIVESAFITCTSLQSINIPDSVTEIGASAFSGCSALTNVKLSNKLTTLNMSLFSNCTSLETIDIPNSVTTIYSMAFYKCTSLKEMVISDNVTFIAGNVFSDCTSLRSITLPFVGSGDTTSYYFSWIFGEVPASLKEVIITGDDAIKDYSFKDCSSLESIELNKNIPSFGMEAFKGCNLLDVYYNGTIEDWCKLEFSNPICNPMNYADQIFMLNSNKEYYEVLELELPDAITEIGSSQFVGFDITNAIIPNSVTTIGGSAFSRCDKLKSITLPFVGKNLDSEFELGTTRFDYIFGTVPDSLKELTITNAKIIYGYAFEGSKLEKVTIVNTDVIIDDSAFIGCNYLTSMTLPFVGRSLDAVENSSFGYIFSSHEAIPQSLKELVITDAKTISDYAFFRATYIESIILPETLISIGKEAFIECTNLKSIVIPDSVASIGDYAFKFCYGLESVHLSTSLTSISAGLFYECHNLKTVNIPNSIETINASAFRSCTALKSIILPTNLKTIGDLAFNSCELLEKVYYKGTEEQWQLIVIGKSNTSLSDATIVYNYVK